MEGKVFIETLALTYNTAQRYVPQYNHCNV